jgi:hypothetical protein
MSARLAGILGAALLLGGCDATAAGREAWHAGRRDEARAEFRREAERAEGAASGELLHDLALAELAAGRYEEALKAAAAAAERDAVRFQALLEFVRGSAAFARSEAAEAEAAEPGADASLFERAAADAEDALARWRLAAADRRDWPEARRNVERALLRLERLRERRREGGPGAKPPPLPPPPAPPTPERPGTMPEETAAAVEGGLLPAAEVQRLFDVLLEKERAKQAARRAARSAPTPGVEKDW